MEIEKASPADLPAIIRLLDESGLPSEDLTPAFLERFWLIWDARCLAGVIGLEAHGASGLLRSLAVAPPYRNKGLAARLVAGLETAAAGMGVQQLYLLTTTAENYFARLGYRKIDRLSAPDALQATAEFRSLCPSSSVCMQKSLA
jgi:amino-acid N-acetyltransferase